MSTRATKVSSRTALRSEIKVARTNQFKSERVVLWSARDHVTVMRHVAVKKYIFVSRQVTSRQALDKAIVLRHDHDHDDTRPLYGGKHLQQGNQSLV